MPMMRFITIYLRDNPAGLHRELWFHEYGDRSWLIVTRDTVTHAVVDVALARDLALSSKKSKVSKSAKAANGDARRRPKNAHEKASQRMYFYGPTKMNAASLSQKNRIAGGLIDQVNPFVFALMGGIILGFLAIHWHLHYWPIMCVWLDAASNIIVRAAF